ncbi:MAG: hypothetical protein GDA52_01900 [Rhodobacteraceae bacterium]|nr:hypothetical protein [Paracoccaceae bacterium]
MRPDYADDPDRSIPPFTKGITAAACNAGILTNRNVDDALDLLGEDYPYMLDDIDDSSLNEGFRYLKDTYGDTPWQEALDRVMELKNRTSHQSIAAQLHSVIQAVSR